MTKTMWAVGTDSGDFNWKAINAVSEKAAVKQYADEYECDIPLSGIIAERVQMWDNKRQLKPLHWIKAGYGCLCEECGFETYAEFGAIIYRGVVHCGECRG